MGRLHMESQDLTKLQTRKMKVGKLFIRCSFSPMPSVAAPSQGLKRKYAPEEEEGAAEDEEDEE